MNNLDRFDRLILAATKAPAYTPPSVRRALVPLENFAREPVITSSRGPRFADHGTCPMCGVNDLGIEYHGVLMSGAKVHTISAHTAGSRRVDTKQPRCLGSGLRVVFEGGGWKGLS